MKLIICVPLIVLLLNEFHCAPLTNYEANGGYVSEDSSTNSWGYGLGGHFNVGVKGGWQNGAGYLGTENDIGVDISGTRTTGTRKLWNPIPWSHGSNNNQYASQHTPWNGSNTPQFGPPSGPQYGPPPGYQYGPPSGPQYGPPPGYQYGPPSGPQYGPPSGPQYGPPSDPQYGPQSGPQYGPPSRPQYGPPSGPHDGPSPGRQSGPPAGPQ